MSEGMSPGMMIVEALARDRVREITDTDLRWAHGVIAEERERRYLAARARIRQLLSEDE